MIITVISFKGGVGKSVISQNLAVCLSHQKKDVCILDADPNENTTMWGQYRPEEQPTVPVFPLGQGDIIKTINNLSDKYKIVIVDCPPAIEATTSKAVMKSDFSIIPVPTTGGGDLWATEKFLQHLDLIKSRMDIELPCYFLANRHEPNVILHQTSLEAFKGYQETYSIGILETVICKRNAYGEANVSGLGVIEGDNKKAKNEVISLTEEILKIKSNGKEEG